MKTKLFLAILFFTITVSAQERTTKFIWDKDFPKREDTQGIIYSDAKIGSYRVVGTYKDTTYVSVDFFAKMALDLWASYKKDCTAEYRFEKLKRDSVWLPPYPEQWKEWLEKKPTFEGFMEYLSKKLAREK